MTTPDTTVHEHDPDSHHDVYSRTIFGFWVYIVTDFMVFTALFATYDVLHNNTFGGPSARDLFNIHFTLLQTCILLVSSFIVGLAGISVHRKHRGATIILFALTFLLGIVFMWMMGAEFSRFVAAGHDWKQSAFLSIYFTLVGTLGIHVLFALVWMIFLIIPVCVHGIKPVSIKRLTCLKMFWQFINIVWIFIFTIVYLLGVK